MTFAGTVSAGGVVSRTVTVKVRDETLPAASVAVTVTVVVPSANIEPEACEYVIVTGPTASVAVAAAYETAAPAGLVASTVRFGLTDGIAGARRVADGRP